MLADGSPQELDLFIQRLKLWCSAAKSCDTIAKHENYFDDVLSQIAALPSMEHIDQQCIKEGPYSKTLTEGFPRIITCLEDVEYELEAYKAMAGERRTRRRLK